MDYMRYSLLAIVLLLWMALGMEIHLDHQLCCITNSSSNNNANQIAVKDSAIDYCNKIVCFDKSGCEPKFCTKWAPMLDTLEKRMAGKNQFIITGYYSSEEVEGGIMDSLGLCRAQKIKDVLEKKFPHISILCEQRQSNGLGRTEYCKQISIQLINI